jgi:hypothetical protein
LFPHQGCPCATSSSNPAPAGTILASALLRDGAKRCKHTHWLNNRAPSFCTEISAPGTQCSRTSQVWQAASMLTYAVSLLHSKFVGATQPATVPGSHSSQFITSLSLKWPAFNSVPNYLRDRMPIICQPRQGLVPPPPHVSQSKHASSTLESADYNSDIIQLNRVGSA